MKYNKYLIEKVTPEYEELIKIMTTVSDKNRRKKLLKNLGYDDVEIRGLEGVRDNIYRSAKDSGLDIKKKMISSYREIYSNIKG